MDVEPKEGRRSTPGESPLAGPHRALDGIGRFADPDALKALRVVGKRFNAHSRLPAAIRRCFEKRWAARSVSKRARWRLEAVEAMGRCLGVDAEEFLTKTLKGDKLQAVRAASAGWLARIARRAAPETKKRIFAAACERYDAEQHVFGWLSGEHLSVRAPLRMQAGAALGAVRWWLRRQCRDESFRTLELRPHQCNWG